MKCAYWKFFTADFIAKGSTSSSYPNLTFVFSGDIRMLDFEGFTFASFFTS
jgi:hypothetical protein